MKSKFDVKIRNLATFRHLIPYINIRCVLEMLNSLWY